MVAHFELDVFAYRLSSFVHEHACTLLSWNNSRKDIWIMAFSHYIFFVRNRRRRSEEHTSELQSRFDLVCRLLLEKKNEGATEEYYPKQVDCASREHNHIAAPHR